MPSTRMPNNPHFPASRADRLDLTERIERVQKTVNWTFTAVGVFGLWKLGKGIYKMSRKLKGRH